MSMYLTVPSFSEISGFFLNKRRDTRSGRNNKWKREKYPLWCSSRRRAPDWEGAKSGWDARSRRRWSEIVSFYGYDIFFVIFRFLGLVLHRCFVIIRQPFIFLVFNERIKYIEIDCHYVRDEIQAQRISSAYIPTASQPVDVYKGFRTISVSPSFGQVGHLQFTSYNLTGGVGKGNIGYQNICMYCTLIWLALIVLLPNIA